MSISVSGNIAATKVTYENLRSLAFGSISGTYAKVGTSWSNPARMIRIHNWTDANLIISFNGVTDKAAIHSQSSQVLDYCSNASEQAGHFEQAAQSAVYVRLEGGAVITSGNVYLEVIYASAV